MRKAPSIIMVLFFLDAFTKWLAFKYFTFGLNPYLAFGIPIPHEATLIVIPLMLIIFVWFLKRYYKETTITLWIFCFIIAGGLGNYINQLLLGGGIDFINIGSFPDFNLADIYLGIGSFLLIFFHGKLQKE